VCEPQYGGVTAQRGFVILPAAVGFVNAARCGLGWNFYLVFRVS